MQLCKGRVPTMRRWELEFLERARAVEALVLISSDDLHLLLRRSSTKKQRCAVSFIPSWLLMPRNGSLYSFVHFVDKHNSEYMVQHEFATS
eukprot:scaffold69631_cov23-Cyclotella_meneghiniana.AAC.1